MKARLRRSTALLGAAILGAIITITLRGGASAPAAPAAPALSTAAVVRTDLRNTVLTAGTLGYAPVAPVINQLAGTYTQLPAVGSTIKPGGTLYRVDNVPAVLMAGATPAWRPFVVGMTDGPDISELQANLIALGDANGLLLGPTGRYDWLTVDGVERWQLAEHVPVTGQIALGEIMFVRSAVRVGAESVAPGQTASPGQAPYQATGTAPTVTVPVNPNLPTTRLGERVSITLPSGATVPGMITAIGPVPPAAPSGSAGSGPSPGSEQLTVRPDQPVASAPGTEVAVQVSLTTSSMRGVLVVPVSALLALAGGGYGVELLEPTGAHRLVGVQTGAFAGSQVQVSGTGIRRGVKVVVAQ